MLEATRFPTSGSGYAARGARLVVLGIIIGIGIGHLYWSVVTWPLGDMHVYLDAAARMREGRPLYVPGDVGVNSFWYAPWFAAAWIPLTYLPREVVSVLWSAVLLVATGLVVVVLVRMGRRAGLLALLIGPALFAVSAGGNVQALMVLALLVGLYRPWGPIAIAAAASLKFAPILLVLVYVARREWGRLALTLVVTAVLAIPSLMMGLVAAGPRSEAAASLIGISPILYGLSVLAVGAMGLLLSRWYAPLAAATAVVLALPRLYVYDVTIMAVACADEGRRS